ncbi:MAG TPA: thiamine pyrophosphate-dependent enzyme [Bacteroidales bacterium]|jgi:2-oxoglutarate ferredoxin oxidoreductase subunit beta|nr:thiamine pyrophosphate-dependent enzyme [Bacteroidales bacterium]HQH24518.1 thiamine pyrophosphate-dependent enzyme [Bacteroidales bacterium]HQJ83275.1 thiamine pyrophosphate-dependent enzyme [Bacteroidales bacterium]
MAEVTGIKDYIRPENLVYSKTRLMTDNVLHYCPGCGHSTAHRILAEIIDEEGLQQDAIGISPVGCSVFLYNYIDIDWQEAAHGRAPALATAIKRLCPDKFVFTYQGDGDLAAIGTSETIHSCNRGENFLIIFINNGIYGMTGGQMAPTTIPGMKSSTSPYGRDTVRMGFPLKITDIVATLPGTYYVSRQSVHTALNVRRAKRALKKAVQYQSLNRGTCFVEIVSNCPAGWKMTPVEANKWLEENMLPYYPLGDLKVPQPEKDLNPGSTD